MKLFIQDELTTADTEILFKWAEQVFPIEARDFKWTKPQKHIVVKDNGTPIAHLGYGIYPIEFDDINTYTVGVGGVVVRPEHQGERIPTQLFETLHALDHIPDKNIEQKFDGIKSSNTLFSLFCPERLVTYYNRFGYELSRSPVKFLQQGKLVSNGSACLMLKNQTYSGHINIPSEPW